MTGPRPEPGDLLLPAGACLLHIGPYKTGSSAIQAALAAARPELHRHGAAYPGTEVRARRAGWAVIGSTPRGRRRATRAEWLALVEEVRAAGDLRVCVSTEDLGRVGPTVARRVVEGLGADRLHVLTVVRRLDRLLPSQWQQRAQSFKTDTFDDYLKAVLDPAPAARHPAHQAFWAAHDVGRVLATWSAELGPERVVAVVADEADRTQLPRTVEALLGLPVGLLEPGEHGNASLPHNAVELLRRLNVEAQRRGWPDSFYASTVREVVGHVRRTGPGPGDRRVPGLPAWAAPRVEELSRARAEAVASSGVRVVGDVRSLAGVHADPGADGGAPDTLSVQAAVAAFAGAVHRYEHDRTRLRERLDAASRRRRPAAPQVREVPGRVLVGELGRRARRRVTPARGGAR